MCVFGTLGWSDVCLTHCRALHLCLVCVCVCGQEGVAEASASCASAGRGVITSQQLDADTPSLPSSDGGLWRDWTS